MTFGHQHQPGVPLGVAIAEGALDVRQRLIRADVLQDVGALEFDDLNLRVCHRDHTAAPVIAVNASQSGWVQVHLADHWVTVRSVRSGRRIQVRRRAAPTEIGKRIGTGTPRRRSPTCTVWPARCTISASPGAPAEVAPSRHAASIPSGASPQAVSAATIVMLLWGLGAQARRRLVWRGERLGRSLLLGVLGAMVVVTPFALLYLGTPIEQRGGVVALSALPALLAMALVGNALEELLFRGYLYDVLASDGGGRAPRRAELRAALATGVLFAAGHLHLAMIVTDVGFPLIVFVLVEGLVCGLVRLRAGIVGSTLTHGLAIFVLASGLL